MANLFVLLLLAAIIGIFKPYVKGTKRWHFGLVALVCFVAIGITAPDPEKKDNLDNSSPAIAATAKKVTPVKPVDHSGAVNSFQSSVISTMKPCDKSSQALEKMAEIFDGNMRPSTVQEARELAEGSQAGILACAAGFFLIANEAGVDVKQLKFGE